MLYNTLLNTNSAVAYTCHMAYVDSVVPDQPVHECQSDLELHFLLNTLFYIQADSVAFRSDCMDMQEIRSYIVT